MLPTTASPAFVPLRIFSAYTMLEGAIDPKGVAKAARALGFPAAAVTDRNGLYGAMAFSAACRAEGVQPIIATLLAVARPDGIGGAEAGKPAAIDWLALYAQDEGGYDNLCALVSQAHLGRPGHEEAHVPLAALAGRSDGLIALTAAGEGALARLFSGGQRACAEAYADRLETLFPGRLYIEIARRGERQEEQAEAALIDLAYARDLPLVATNPASFAEARFHAAHDIMLCIAQSAYVDTVDRRRSSPEAWLKPADDMAARFADLPEAIANTLVVAQRCAVAAPRRKPILPSLAGDPGAEAALLRDDARAGLVERLRNLPIANPTPFVPSEVGAPSEAQAARPSTSLGTNGGLEDTYKAYFARLDFELDVIVGMGFPGYFLIVADFIKWAKDQGIPVGPGRGSGAGSVVAWALTITDLDPLKLGLLFERFLNPERVSMPDFDIDFCETRRGEVIRYVQDKYGVGQVAQIITFGRLKARAVLKDTGRVLQMSYGQVDRLAKLVPNHPTDPWTLQRALDGVSELHTEYKRDAEVRRLFDLAKELEGLPRHASTHAAGVVIGDRPLDRLVPLYRDPRSDLPITQFDMKYVEEAGLVKFDFLGLKTLSVLQKAVEMLGARGIAVDLAALPWDDEATYRLLQSGNTVGVFQVESEGMRRTLSAVKPTVFEDIIALGALYRPGPMDNIPMFGARKNGQEPIGWPHPLLEGILAETYGVFVYQEQVMQAAQVLAGYSLGEADLLRRAMGKKIQAEMDAQRARFVDGCGTLNAIPPAKANELFDLIDKFAGYGFNKSHAAAYALLTYQTAWLKTHHVETFFAASMCYDMGQTDKLAIFAEDMRRMGVRCLNPCVNRSAADFTVEPVEDGLAVRYALGALKGVGEKAMEQLCDARAAAGPFASLDDLADRIDPRLLNRRQLESLAAAGALEMLAADRATGFAAVETILAHAASAASARETGQGGLFGEAAGGTAPMRLAAVQPWTISERMHQEKEAFGFYHSAHPTDRYAHVAAQQMVKSYGELCTIPVSAGEDRFVEGRRVPQPSFKVAALVEDVRWRTSARGKRYLLATCSDASGQFVASCFDEAAAGDVEAAARTGGCGLMTVELDRRPGEETPRVTIRAIRPLEEMVANVRLTMTVTTCDPAVPAALARLMAGREGGRSELRLVAGLAAGGTADLVLGRGLRIDGDLTEAVRRLNGVDAVELSAPEARLAAVG